MTEHGPAVAPGRVIVVADTTPVFLAGLAAVLGGDGHQVLAAATPGELRDLLPREPDLALVELALLRQDDGLQRACQQADVALIVSVPHTGEDVMSIVTDGVNGLWDRQGEVTELRRVVAAALSGAPAISPDAGAALLDRLGRATAELGGRLHKLTEREQEILERMADGSGNRDIAEALFISENTVRNHVRNVLDKLQARTRTEAVVRAVKAGLIRLT